MSCTETGCGPERQQKKTGEQGAEGTGQKNAEENPKGRRKKICRDTLRVRVYRGDEWLSEKPDQGCLPLQQDDPACDTDSCSGKPIRIIHAHSHGPDGQLLWRLPPALSAGGISLLFRLGSARYGIHSLPAPWTQEECTDGFLNGAYSLHWAGTICSDPETAVP